MEAPAGSEGGDRLAVTELGGLEFVVGGGEAPRRLTPWGGVEMPLGGLAQGTLADTGRLSDLAERWGRSRSASMNAVARRSEDGPAARTGGCSAARRGLGKQTSAALVKAVQLVGQKRPIRVGGVRQSCDDDYQDRAFSVFDTLYNISIIVGLLIGAYPCLVTGGRTASSPTPVGWLVVRGWVRLGGGALAPQPRVTGYRHSEPRPADSTDSDDSDERDERSDPDDERVGAAADLYSG
jgi:hypothetical protein